MECFDGMNDVGHTVVSCGKEHPAHPRYRTVVFVEFTLVMDMNEVAHDPVLVGLARGCRVEHVLVLIYVDDAGCYGEAC